MADVPERSQSDKFRDLARELGADEDEEAFAEALRRIAINPPQPKSDDQSGAE